MLVCLNTCQSSIEVSEVTGNAGPTVAGSAVPVEMSQLNTVLAGRVK